jgi:hypothetical protein
MRGADGGKLTAGDKAALNRRQNRASGNIYNTTPLTPAD